MGHITLDHLTPESCAHDWVLSLMNQRDGDTKLKRTVNKKHSVISQDLLIKERIIKDSIATVFNGFWKFSSLVHEKHRFMQIFWKKKTYFKKKKEKEKNGHTNHAYVLKSWQNPRHFCEKSQRELPKMLCNVQKRASVGEVLRGALLCGGQKG